MHDFFCTNPNDMYSAVLAERARFFKESEEGVTTMCRVMEELYNEGVAEGREEGREEGRGSRASKRHQEPYSKSRDYGRCCDERPRHRSGAAPQISGAAIGDTLQK